MDDQQHIKGVIEALLFISEKPVTLDQIKKVLETVSSGEIKKAIQALKSEKEDTKAGTKIVEIAGGFQMLSHPNYVAYIKKLYKTKHKEKLSKPSLETIAIIAYKQPVTRSDIESIRGVNSDGVVSHLLNKELIKIVGRKDVPGKPFLYGTTKQFMEYFGLRSLEDLPKLEEFPQLLPEYEKEKEDTADILNEDEQAIPTDAVEMNSLEQTKQKAIKSTEEVALESKDDNTEEQTDIVNETVKSQSVEE